MMAMIWSVYETYLFLDDGFPSGWNDERVFSGLQCWLQLLDVTQACDQQTENLPVAEIQSEHLKTHAWMKCHIAHTNPVRSLNLNYRHRCRILKLTIYD